MNSEDQQKALLAEYSDVSANLRHHGNMQFAQLTIYFAFSGALGSRLFAEQPITGLPRIVVCIAGIVLGLAFLSMSARIGEYWNSRVIRAKEIEYRLGLEQYRQTPTTRFISNRAAVAICYWVVVGGFAGILFSQIFS